MVACTELRQLHRAYSAINLNCCDGMTMRYSLWVPTVVLRLIEGSPRRIRRLRDVLYVVAGMEIALYIC